jgi:glyoxylase-like metal-dependent hydrolase (beta-lactamase superfamily II)
VRALSIHSDLVVFVSQVWQTTCTAVRAGDELFVIDSVVYPEELDALGSVLEQAGFPLSGLLATHGDWDHLLGRLAFPQASLGVGESTAERLAAEPGEAQRALRRFDEEHYVEDRPPLALAGVQSLPVPGHLELGSQPRELELHRAEGHTADGTAFLIPWLGVLVCGDYLSPVEIPVISAGGSVEAYLETLTRLASAVQRSQTIVPGHGRPIDREQALALLSEDTAYLRAVAAEGPDAPLPSSRRTLAQRQIHAANVERIVGMRTE